MKKIFMVSMVLIVMVIGLMFGNNVYAATSGPKMAEARVEVTSNKEYDISTFDDLYLYYSSMASADYGYVNYKLYNNSEETAEE